MKYLYDQPKYWNMKESWVEIPHTRHENPSFTKDMVVKFKEEITTSVTSTATNSTTKTLSFGIKSKIEAEGFGLSASLESSIDTSFEASSGSSFSRSTTTLSSLEKIVTIPPRKIYCQKQKILELSLTASYHERRQKLIALDRELKSKLACKSRCRRKYGDLEYEKHCSAVPYLQKKKSFLDGNQEPDMFCDDIMPYMWNDKCLMKHSPLKIRIRTDKIRAFEYSY